MINVGVRFSNSGCVFTVIERNKGECKAIGKGVVPDIKKNDTFVLKYSKCKVTGVYNRNRIKFIECYG